MKLDGDQILCNGSAGNKSECKLVESNDNNLESAEFRLIVGSVKENHQESLSDLKDMRDDADQLSCRINEGDWNASELDSTMMVNDSTNDTEKAVRKFVALVPSNHSLLKADSFNDSFFYADKTVTERDLPELIVCYKENTYQIVKDICVDEGVPSQDKFLFKTDADVDQKPLCTFSPLENEQKNEIVEDNLDLDVPVSDALKLSVEKKNCDFQQCVLDEMEFSEVLGSQSGSSSDFDSRDLQLAGNEILDKTKQLENGVPKKPPSLGHLLLVPDIDAEISCPKPSNDSTENSKLRPFQKLTEDPKLDMISSCEERESRDKEVVLFSPKMVSADKGSDHFSEEVNLTNLSLGCAADKLDRVFQKIDMASPTVIPAAQESENVHEEADLTSTALTSQADDVDIIGKEAKLEPDAFIILTSDKFPDNAVDELAYPRKMENGGITSKLDSTAPALNSCLPNANEVVHFGTQNGVTEPVSDLQRSSLGETSFSASGPPSGLITYSGSIAYSGSVSVRSDSSTTSTRSFAFPILQSEWNSSPVKMAKADRKHFRKRSGWRHGFLCCKFF